MRLAGVNSTRSAVLPMRPVTVIVSEPPTTGSVLLNEIVEILLTAFRWVSWTLVNEKSACSTADSVPEPGLPL